MKHVSERLQAYLDGELSPEEAVALENHLAGCDRCRRDHDALHAVWTEVERVAAPELERSLWPGVAASLAARQARRRLPAGLAAAAVAAGLLLGLGLGGVLPGPHRATGPETATVVPGTVADAEIFDGVTTLDEMWWSLAADQEDDS